MRPLSDYNFIRDRWGVDGDENGNPVCPKCQCACPYRLSDPSRRYKCKDCGYKFSDTAHSVAHAHKIPPEKIWGLVAELGEYETPPIVILAQKYGVDPTTVRRIRKRFF